MPKPNKNQISKQNVERMIIWCNQMGYHDKVDQRLRVKLMVWLRHFNRYQELGINKVDLSK